MVFSPPPLPALRRWSLPAVFDQTVGSQGSSAVPVFLPPPTLFNSENTPVESLRVLPATVGGMAPLKRAWLIRGDMSPDTELDGRHGTFHILTQLAA